MADLVTHARAAAHLGITSRELKFARERKTNPCPAHKLRARVYRYDLEALDEWQRGTSDLYGLQVPEHGSYEMDTDAIERHAMMERVLAVLPPRERTVINMRFLQDYPATLDEVGAEINVTRERVRQLEGQALNRMQRGWNVLTGTAPPPPPRRQYVHPSNARWIKMYQPTSSADAARWYAEGRIRAQWRDISEAA